MVGIHLEGRVANESGHRARNVGGSAEGHDGDHGETAVVELGGLLLLESLGVDAREVNRREDDGGEVAALSVVSAPGLGDELGEEDGEVDLLLSGFGDGGPGIEGLHGRKRLEGDVLGGGEHAGEVEAGALDEVAGGGKHGASSVLELSGTEPGESGLRSEISKAKGIEGLEGHR